jgi:UDP-glucose 4-epimerase
VKALVTGGCGFIGSHLVDALVAAGHDVRVIDNLSTGQQANLEQLVASKRVELIVADIQDADAVARSMDDRSHVFHLAALADIVPSINSPMDYFASNVTGTTIVVEAARKAGVEKFIYTASSSCYGIPDKYPTPETAEIRPQYPYALTKWLGEEVVRHWSQVYGLPSVSLRLFNVYGPRSRTAGTYGAVFGVFLAQKLAGQPMTIVGDGTQRRDFTYVTDVVSAFIAAAEFEQTGLILNVGTGNAQSINHLVQLLGGESVHIPKRPGEPDITLADVSAISQSLHWSPRVNFETGVKRMLENIDYWRDAPVWDPDSIADATEVWFDKLGRSE